MSNAFAPRAFDDFEDDEFDLDMGYVAQGAPGAPAGSAVGVFPADGAFTEDDAAARTPLQFTAPAVQAPAAPQAPRPALPEPMAHAEEFNPVGDLVAGAQAAFSPP
ncbi:MAG: hypothetical protein EON86_15305, partial [Brevundimonas sp.]